MLTFSQEFKISPRNLKELLTGHHTFTHCEKIQWMSTTGKTSENYRHFYQRYYIFIALLGVTHLSFNNGNSKSQNMEKTSYIQ